MSVLKEKGADQYPKLQLKCKNHKSPPNKREGLPRLEKSGEALRKGFPAQRETGRRESVLEM